MRWIALCLITSVLSLNTYAQEKKTCKDVIEKCDAAIESQKKVIKAGEDALAKSQEQVEALKEQVKAKEEKESNFLRQPPVLLGTGVLATVIGGPIAGIVGFVVLTIILQ